jgi:hypothetical protein
MVSLYSRESVMYGGILRAPGPGVEHSRIEIGLETADKQRVYMRRARVGPAGERPMGLLTHRSGFAFVAVLLFVTVLSVLGLSFLSRSGIGTSAVLGRDVNMQAEYLAEAAANDAMWRLLNDPAFPAAEDRYYMSSLGAGRYGYMVRRHTGTTFATVSALGAVGDCVVTRSYVLDVRPPAATGSMITGSYMGDGTDDRAITGVGFQPDLVIVKSERNYHAVARTSTMTGDAAKPMEGSNAVDSDLIESLDADGFTVGSANAVNRSGYMHYWAAFRAVSGRMEVGTYVGDGTSGRAFTGMSLSPALVIVIPENDDPVIHKSTLASQSYDFGNGNPMSNCVLDPLLSDGFRVGDDSGVNQGGIVYHYLCWSNVAGLQAFGGYTGDGGDDRDMHVLSFEPEYCIVKCTSQKQSAVHRTASLSGDETLYFRTSWNDSDEIQALLPDGFQLGGGTEVNRSNREYTYYAWARD